MISEVLFHCETLHMYSRVFSESCNESILKVKQ